jgi:hypothetical protein
VVASYIALKRPGDAYAIDTYEALLKARTEHFKEDRNYNPNQKEVAQALIHLDALRELDPPRSNPGQECSERLRCPPTETTCEDHRMGQ